MLLSHFQESQIMCAQCPKNAVVMSAQAPKVKAPCSNRSLARLNQRKNRLNAGEIYQEVNEVKKSRS